MRASFQRLLLLITCLVLRRPVPLFALAAPQDVDAVPDEQQMSKTDAANFLTLAKDDLPALSELLSAANAPHPDAAVDTKSKMTALSQACMRGDRDAMELLMQHGANPNAVDRDGDACLHIAAGMGWAKTIVLLLRHGADPSLQNKRGQTPLAAAREAKYKKVIKVLEELEELGRESIIDKYKGEL